MTQGHHPMRSRFQAALCMMTLISLTGLAAGCGPLSNTESAVLVSIRSADSSLSVGSISLELVDDLGATTSSTFNDLGNWPANPEVHTVLVRATTEAGANRHVDINVFACNTTAGCTSTDTSTVASGSVAGGVDFIGGDLLQDRAVTLQ